MAVFKPFAAVRPVPERAERVAALPYDVMNRQEGERLQAIEGLPPSLIDPPAGCPFAERCEYATEQCRKELPSYVEFSETHRAMCHLCRKGGN